MADVGQEAEALTVVLTRLASTPDEALEKLLVRLLPVVIKKLSLGDPTVQKRVLAILSHVNKRIQPLPTLRLPLAELAGVYTSPTAGPMSRNFAAVYLERAGARATPADVADVLETLIPGLARRQEAHQSMFLKLILWGLPHFDKRYASPGGEEGPPPVLADASDRAFFLSFACQLLTYQPPPASAAPADPARSVPGTSAALAALLNGAEALTAGPGALAAAKRGSLGACAAWCRDPRDLLLPCTLACAEPDDAVAERGQATLRTLGDLSAVVEEEGVVKVLMESGLGTEPVEGAAAAAPGPDAPSLASAAGASAAGAAATSHPLQSLLHPVPPAPPAALLRALGLLTRSAAAAADVPRALALVRVALASPQRRLRTAGAEFAAWVFCHAALADLAPAADPALAACLALVLDGAGETAGAADAGTRGAALRAVGTLAQRVPACLAGRVDVAAALFEALAREPAGTRALLQETLAGASQAFAGAQADAGARAQVLAVLAAHIRSPQEAARATALQWAAKVFPGEDVEARYLAVVAAGDVRGAVAAAAVDSLTPVPGTREERGLPRFLDMLGCLLRHHPALGRVGAVGADSGLSLKSLAAAVRFLERLRRSEIERMEAALPPAALASYAALLAPGLGPNAPTALQAGALRALLGALGAGAVGRRPAVDEATATALGPRAAALTAHANAPVRGLAARVAGRLHAALPGSVRDAWRRCLEQAAAGKRVGVEEALGAAAALGLVAARGVLEGQEPPPEGWVAALASCVTTGVVDPEVRLTAAQSLAFLAAAAREAGGGVAGEQTPLAGIDWSEVVAAIVPLLEPSCSQIVQQGAVGALGTLAWAVPEAGILESVAEALLGLHGRRGEALLFPTGEALCLVFGGTRLQLHHLLDIEYLGLASLDGPRGGTPGGAAPVSTERQAVQAKILEAVVGRFPDSAKAEQRAAGAAWLTALLQHVGPSPLILARLSAIQEALIPMLGEDSELVQELASRGLIETHGLASGATREELVKRLIVALSGNTHKRPAASLSGATDAANGTGTAVAGGAGGAGTKSGALLVYRELASMAAALSEPELLYHFMELALQTSATTSGPGRPTPTVTQASLNASLPRILPRLFRHRFDPNPKVQAAMSRVWLLLVDDGAALLDAQLGPLLDALLADMGQPAWRVRESAALAAAELARGRGWGDLAPRYQPLWNMGLRVLDDVKESVRAAGLALVRTLRGFALRATGTEGGADLTQGATVAAVLLPILLQGLASSAAEVRAVCLECLTTVCRQAPPALLRQHVATLVPPLLEALSGLEDSRLNFVEQHAAGLGLDTDRLDGARASAAQSGPVGDTLDACSRVLDEASLAALAPGLASVVRRGVGVATRAGAGAFIARTARRLGGGCAPAVAPLLGPLVAAALAEPSAEVRRGLASAAAALARHGAGPQRTQRALAVLLDAARGEDGRVLAAGQVLLRFASEAQEKVAGVMADVAPLAYLLKFSGEAEAAAVWERVWEESTASVGSGVRLLAAEICREADAALAGASWGAKRAGAAALAAAAAAAPEAVAPHAGVALAALLEQLPGRLWDGKEALLGAVPPLLCAATLDVSGGGGGDVWATAVAALLAAAERPRAAYHAAALRALARVLEENAAAPAGDAAQARDVHAALLDLAGRRVARGGAEGAGGGEAAGPAPAPELAICLAAAWTAAGRPNPDRTLEVLCSLPLGTGQVEAVGALLRAGAAPSRSAAALVVRALGAGQAPDLAAAATAALEAGPPLAAAWWGAGLGEAVAAAAGRKALAPDLRRRLHAWLERAAPCATQVGAS